MCPIGRTLAFAGLLWIGSIGIGPVAIAAEESSQARPPRNTEDLTWWLSNMSRHSFSTAEMSAVTGLSSADIDAALVRLNPDKFRASERHATDALLVLPYPGGRHPRLGFLDGAIRPQRETKVSVFAPWDATSYVVVDVPEALWSNLGLTYLAHTHIPTVFDKQGVKLGQLEWDHSAADGTLRSTRRLPNGIRFDAVVKPGRDAVRMQLTLTNGTPETLRDLRVQMCVMLKGAAGFTEQTNANKIFQKPYVACRSEDGARWIITAWDPCDRAWANAPVPCLHSDPKFPDCPPGESRLVRGWLSFFQGTNVTAELERIEKSGWRAGGWGQ